MEANGFSARAGASASAQQAGRAETEVPPERAAGA